MTPETLPPLEGSIRALLDDAGALEPLPASTRDRLRERLGVSLGAAALGSGAAAVGLLRAKPAIAGAWAGRTWWLVTGAFLCGGALGAAGHAMLHRSGAPAAARTVYVERRVELPAAFPATAPSPPALAPSPPPVAATVTSGQQSAHPSATVAAPSVVKDTGLAAERALLEVARTALSRGDPLAAIGSLVEHEKRFARGQLAEEREALYVQALAQAGRRAEAKQRAERFRATWPASMLLPVVESATQ